MFKVNTIASLAALMILGACGGSGAGSVPSPTPGVGTTPVATQAPQSGAQKAITKLETSSDLPTLDRSASLAGPDVDRNGVRDDVDAYIKKNYIDPKEAAAVTQMAKGMQAAVLVDPKDAVATTIVSESLDRAIRCISDQFADAGRAGKAVDVMEAVTPNTKKRLLAYLAYNHSQDGTVSQGFQQGVNTCD
jgi:hypothetical protein